MHESRESIQRRRRKAWGGVLFLVSLDILVVLLSIWHIMQIPFLFVGTVFPPALRVEGLLFGIASILSVLVVVVHTLYAIKHRKRSFHIHRQKLLKSKFAGTLFFLVIVCGNDWNTQFLGNPRPLCLTMADLGLLSQPENVCPIYQLNVALSFPAALLLGPFFSLVIFGNRLVVKSYRRQNVRRHAHRARQTSDEETSFVYVSTSESEIEDTHPRHGLNPSHGSTQNLERSLNVEELNLSPMPFRSSSTKQKSPITVPQRIHSSFDTSRSLTNQRLFTDSDSTLAMLSPLARNPSVVSSLGSFPSTSTMRSSPPTASDQVHMPKIPPVPIRFQKQQPTDIELAFGPSESPPSRSKSRPQLPPQDFWLHTANNEMDDGSSVSQKPQVQRRSSDEVSPGSEQKYNTVRVRQPSMHRYSTLPPRYQGQKAPKASVLEDAESPSVRPSLARSGVSYEDLRKGPSIFARTSFDLGLDFLGELQQNEEVNRWKGDEQPITRKQSRTLMKQRQP